LFVVKMMKIFVAVALVAVAVSAGYTYIAPQMPCSFTAQLHMYSGGKPAANALVTVRGRFLKIMEGNVSQVTGRVIRPDISKIVNKDLYYAMFITSSLKNQCEMVYSSEDTVLKIVNDWNTHLFMGKANLTWERKDLKKYRGNECEYYYNKDDTSIYVYDKYISGIKYKEGGIDKEVTFDYFWGVGMDEFVLDKDTYPQCYRAENKMAEIPSTDNVLCGASTLKVAFVTILLAFACLLF